MSELDKGVDKVAAATDKAIDEAAGLTRNVLGGAVSLAKAVIAAPVVALVGAVIEDKLHLVHDVAQWVASVL